MPAKIVWTPEELERLSYMWYEESWHSLFQAFPGKSKANIAQQVRAMNLPRFREGDVTVQDLMKITGFSRWTVLSYLKLYKVELKAINQRGKPNGKERAVKTKCIKVLNLEEGLEATKKYLETESVNQVADEHGVSRKALIRHLKKHKKLISLEIGEANCKRTKNVYRMYTKDIPFFVENIKANRTIKKEGYYEEQSCNL